MKSGYKRGFTLIELLVVISIIGLLSSIALASLNTARLRAKDTAIKSAMLQMRLLYAQTFATKGDYADWQFSNTNVGGCGGPNGEYYCTVGTGGATCSTIFLNAINVPNTEAVKICENIVSNVGASNSTQFAMGAPYNVPTGIKNSFSIAAWLPYKSRYFCVGNRGTSDTENSYLTGTITYDANEPLGCSQNP